MILVLTPFIIVHVQIIKFHSKLWLPWQLIGKTKKSCQEPLGLELNYLVCNILQWTSYKVVQIMAPPLGIIFYIGLYRENLKNLVRNCKALELKILL